MKPPDGNITPAETFSDGKDDVTGLPWLCTWRCVYLFVFGCFMVWVALLLALTLTFS